MLKYLKTFICYVLTFAMLITLLPPQVYEASTTVAGESEFESANETIGYPGLDSGNSASLQDLVTQGNTVSMDDTVALKDAKIVMELTDRRTEYSKEYRLDNGLNLAVVYSEPVHYKENGKWEDIDNTLFSQGTGESASYKNKAGAWQVEFPQQLDEESKVKITKDGYTVSFLMSGELRLDTAMTELRTSVGTAKASKVKKSQGKVHKYDYSKLKEQAQHPEVIRDNLRSRMTYSDVYTNTDVIYDLDTQQLKESIVINTYDPSVYGYVYTLDTGNLISVLNEDGSVDLLTKNKGEVVMTMPAPFMIDNGGEVCTDVSVTLEKVKGTYQLTYLLPMEWMEDENRAWPVVLDPVVKPGTKTSNILDHFVAENYSASNTHKYLYAGHHATYGDMRTYIQFSNIPDFTAADIVVNAKLKLNRIGGSSGSTIIEAHEVYDTWTTSGITWAGQPSWNSIIQDYCSVGGSGEYSWDITDIAYGWYLGENTGVMLKATTDVENSSAANWKQFCSAEYNKTDSSYWPYLEITYQTATGIEEYWDYTTTSAGRAGNGYINNTTGNLTWVNSDLGFDGNRMPVSISHIYTLSERSETKYGLGKGWRTNFHQTVELAESGGYYIWRDADGTMHDFNEKSTNTYVDEDGLRLTLTVSSNGYTITDIYGNTSNFDNSGRLVSMVNNQPTPSQITITYNGTSNRIATITDGANRVYKFTYNTSNLLTQIGYHGKKKTDGSIGAEITNVQFAYSSSKLTKITYKDGLDSHFTYDGTKLLTAMDIDDYKVKFGYSTGITKRAVSIEEFDGTIAGNKITIEYAHNKAKISDSEHTVIHHYNDYGNLISTQDEEGNGQFYQYAANGYEETPAYKNQLKAVSKEQNTVTNLASHGSFEGGCAWTPLVQSSISTTTEKAYIGDKALRIMLTSSVSRISAYGEAINLPGGKTCTFTAYVQSVETSVHLGLGTTSSYYVISDTQDTGSGWVRLEVSYTNPSKDAITIYPLIILGDAGYAYVDCVQVELSAGASRYNLIENGDFRVSGYWSSSCGIRTTLSDLAAPQLSDNVYKMTGSPNTMQSIEQTIGVSGNAGDVFVLSGWAKGNSVPLNTGPRQFALRLIFNNTDGSTKGVLVSFDEAYDVTGDWQYTAGRIEAEKAYSSVKVALVYSCNANDVYFDGIQLFKEEFGERYDYDEDGNLTEVIDVLGLTTTYEYENNDLTTIVEPSGVTTVNDYENHNLISSSQFYTDEENDATVNLATYTYEYNDYGNQIAAAVIVEMVDATGNTVNVVKKTTATYSDDNNHLASTTDELGNETLYEYDSNTSVLNFVKYPEDTAGTKTIHKYNEKMFHLELTEITTDQGEKMSVGYTYSNDLLTQVATKSSTYRFGYGDFSLRTSVSVGSQTLATYGYTEDVYHRLESVTYGNGDKVKYTYDDFGRVTKEEYYENGSTTVSWKVDYEYDNSGALATTVDSKTRITTKYYYDTLGRNTGIRNIDGNGNHRLYYTYDNLGRVQTVQEIYAGSKYYTDYTYNGNNQVIEVDAENTTEKYVYDPYERLTEWNTYHGTSTNPLIEKSIEYEEFTGNDGNKYTSNRPKVWSYEADGYKVIYTYGYDANGNIVSETLNQTIGQTTTQKTTTYVYDSANQLIRENNQAANKTWTWTYDNAGNIKSKTEYAYTTGTLGEVVASSTYTYKTGDNEWRDLLINYNGSAVTYDAIGNMLSDGTRSYTWQEGRQLATLSKGSASWSFTYDVNGMRTSRSERGTVYNYTYHGSQLTNMTYGVIELHFSYDASGRPLSFTYTDSTYDEVTYYYMLNLQGDVVGILDSSGNQVVGYSYDAWGRLLATTGSKASTLGYYNPLRYRGYVYDWETGLYYLESRYYNPEIGRFINADNQIAGVGGEVLGYNLFAYAMNNPVNMSDYTGDWPQWATVALGATIAAVAVVATVATLGAAAPAAACVLSMSAMAVGISYTTASALATVAVVTTTVAAAAYTGDMAYAAVTGDSILLNTLFQGNEEAYETGLLLTSMATGGMLELATYSPGVCFVAGTQVLTASGYKSIENVSVGDMVWAENPQTGEKGLKEVVQTFVNEAIELIHVQVEGEEIVTTPEHPFYSPVKGWTAACQLRAGDILVLQNGKYVTIEKVQHEILETPIKVYNFEVVDFHTYYVGKCAVLVHNTCGKRNTPDQEALIKIAKEGKKTGVSRNEADIMWGWSEELGLSGLRNYHPPKYDSYMGGKQFHMKINGMHINIFE